jgi:uncharacterized membrane protein
MAETKKSKYDTNPLDPDYVREADDLWGEEDDARPTSKVSGETREVGSSPSNESARSNVYSEAPTRRYDTPPVDGSYPSVFVPPTYSPPTPYQGGNPYLSPPVSHRPTERAVAGVGLPEKWALILPYAPFYIGVVASLIELFLVPRKEAKVRFHAAQGLALNIAILVIQTLFGVVGTITDSSIGGTLFKTAAFIFLLISMIRVWQGHPHRIAPLGDAGQWLNERIEPRNKS